MFNKALMEKWIWRFLNRQGDTWVKVIKSLYGEVEMRDDGVVSIGRGGRGSS